MTHWIGAEGLVKLVKNSKNALFCYVTKRKLQTQIKYFSLIEIRRLSESVEGLNSSLAIAAGELWPKRSWPLLCQVRA